MPYQTFDSEEVAQYLHLSPTEVERLVKNQDIPVEKRGGRLVFHKADIDAWAEQRILGLGDQRLTEYHKKTSRGTSRKLARDILLRDMMHPEHIAAVLAAKTKASVLREMAALADRTGHVNNRQELLASLEAREALCSTGMPGGLALLHPRQPDSYLFDSCFVALGRTVQAIPFGAPDGKPTHLFFLLGCPDDRLHLHTLARICMLAMKTDVVEQLLQAPDAEAMYQTVVTAEETVLAETAGA